MHDNDLKTYLVEGSEWFKKHHLPESFPAFVAQIPDAINRLTTSMERQSESNDKLSRSIKHATWAGVAVACLVLIWDMLKTFYL
jgi:hypothetical protein